MDKSYKFANLVKDEEIIKDITRYENELAGKTGQDIVLIAYTKEK